MVDFKQTKVDFSNTPRKGRSSQPRATHWVVGSYKYTPCKGKSFITHILKLLPLQGALLTAVYTQALPWARSFCPLPFPSAGDRWFRACGAYLQGMEHTFRAYGAYLQILTNI